MEADGVSGAERDRGQDEEHEKRVPGESARAKNQGSQIMPPFHGERTGSHLTLPMLASTPGPRTSDLTL
jgi:hypothetical protein